MQASRSVVYVVDVPHATPDEIEFMRSVDASLANELDQSPTIEKCNVDLVAQTCSICAGWQRQKLPCSHAAAAILRSSPDKTKREFWENNFGRW